MSSRLFDDPPLKLSAEQVKDALRRRHPAYDSDGLVSEWTCLEEWKDIDLLAVSAWSNQALVGYEVKVSRADYRRELLNPGKRVAAVGGCTEFYFAVPRGLLKPAELEWQQPADWTHRDFLREECPGIKVGKPLPHQLQHGADARYNARCYKGELNHVPAPSTDEYRHRDYTCATCGGTGYLAKSRAELEGPTLWVPPDVGLIEITERGCRVTRKAPRRKPEHRIVPAEAARLVRWTSVRPDPRHAARDSRPSVKRARKERAR